MNAYLGALGAALVVLTTLAHPSRGMAEGESASSWQGPLADPFYRTPPLEAPRKGWPRSVDVVQVDYAPPYALSLSFGRWKGEAFQLQMLTLGGGRVLGSEKTLWLGLFGVGARFPISSSGDHEIGFLLYPLSFEAFLHDPSDDRVLNLWTMGAGLGLARAYYRFSFERIAVEVGISMPVITRFDAIYDCAPPVLLTFGVATTRDVSAP